MRVNDFNSHSKANIAKLDGFNILNECGDNFSKFNIEMVEEGLNYGFDRMTSLFVLMWMMTGWVMLLMAVVICIGFIAALN